jgi:DNA-directed RNA polymerase sigma subunit (sigma70/sigma32)
VLGELQRGRMYSEKMAKLVEPALGRCTTLHKREVFILEHWYGLNGKRKLTDIQLSRKISIPRHRVHSIKKRAIDRLCRDDTKFKEAYDTFVEKFAK